MKSFRLWVIQNRKNYEFLFALRPNKFLSIFSFGKKLVTITILSWIWLCLRNLFDYFMILFLKKIFFNQQLFELTAFYGLLSFGLRSTNKTTEICKHGFSCCFGIFRWMKCGGWDKQSSAWKQSSIVSGFTGQTFINSTILKAFSCYAGASKNWHA